MSSKRTVDAKRMLKHVLENQRTVTTYKLKELLEDIHGQHYARMDAYKVKIKELEDRTNSQRLHLSQLQGHTKATTKNFRLNIHGQRNTTTLTVKLSNEEKQLVERLCKLSEDKARNIVDPYMDIENI